MLLIAEFNFSFSQNVFSSEEDLKKEANKLFEEEDFSNAYPLFSQLLSLYPKDAQYNYKFGTCLLYSSGDKEKAVPYLEYAAQRQTQGVDKEVFFYLGRAYHLNYRFADAGRMYGRYKDLASSRQAEKYNVDLQMEMCENGKRLIKNVTDLSVLEKKEVPETDFFRSYNLSEFNAKLIIKPDDLKSSADKKKKEESVMYVSPDRNKIYYSSYGDDGKNGKDIYFVTRTAAGDLSKPTRLSEVINTKYDEDFPFLHPNGKILYFCSKGHNSMGGYDIFKSEWDDKTNSWGKPVNMDFAINTPDDDILFISDADDKSAYFSSRRESARGMIMVYKIKLERKPLDLAIIQGTLKKEVGDKSPAAKITVTKILKDEVVGVFNTSAADGSYTLTLPNGGKFMFTVESQGFKKSSELVIVPNQQEIKPLKQAIALVNENGTDKLLINNSFDAQVDSADLELATRFIKAKASLDVSPAEQEITAVAIEEPGSTESKKPDGTKNAVVTNDDIIEMSYDEAKQTQKDANELRKSSDAAQRLANQKNELSLQKNKESTELLKNAEAITDQNEKMAQVDKATHLRKEADELSRQGALSLTLANQMDEQARAKQQQADEELKYAKDLDNAIKSGANEKKMNELLARKEELDKKREDLKSSDNFSASLSKQAEEKQVQSSKAMAKYLDLQQDVEDLKKEAARLRNEAEKAGNNAAKQNLIQQAEDMEKESESKKQEADTYGAQGQRLQNQSDSLKSNAALTSSMLKEIQSPSAQGSAATAQSSQDTMLKTTAVNEPKTEPVSSGSVTASTPAQTSPQPAKIISPYVDMFVKQMHEAETIPKELDREQALATIYQSWTDSLDKQIAALKRQLDTTSGENDKKYVQDKIYELQSSVDDKRQRAADSRNKVDNLKLQEALAAASVKPPDTSAATKPAVSAAVIPTDTAVLPSENLQGTENINQYYQNRLAENEKETDVNKKKSKEQKIYSDWSSTLNNESVRLKKAGQESKAEDAEKLSKEKQAIAIQTSTKGTEIGAEHPEPAETAKQPQKDAAIDRPVATDTAAKTDTSAQPANTTLPTLKQTEPAATATATATSPSPNAPATAPKTEPSESPAVLSSVPPKTIKNQKTKDEYTHYVSLKNEAEWSQKNAERQSQQAEDMQKLADEQFRESERLSKLSTTATNTIERHGLKDKSEELVKRSLRNQAKADSIKVLARNSEAEAASRRTESELYLQSLDKAAYEQISAATNYKPSGETPGKGETLPPATRPTAETKTVSSTERTEVAKSAGNPPSAGSASLPSKTEPSASSKGNLQPGASSTASSPAVSPAILKYYGSLFDKLELEGGGYSASKPIPLDPPMPDGLVYKVQIGAFRNPIPQNLFKGLKPITAESTPMGLKRYTAGLFMKFSSANDAKKLVNGLGYRDAFVVAFFNGKRISMNDALAKAKEAGETIEASAFVSGGNKNLPSSLSAGSSVSEARGTDVKSIDGLFYTIQIGVFSKPVTSAQLYNLSPINTERTDNGLIRYTTGRFGDETQASQAKNRIADKGIEDAFVIAYYNGKRIPLPEAKKLAETQGSDVASKGKQETPFFPADTTTSESSAKSLTASSNQGIVFKVQVGAYREQVPVEDANKLLKFSGRGIKTFTDESGLTVYTLGEFLEYESANSLKNEAISGGIAGAFVIAFKDGKKISAAEAQDILKNNK